MILVDNRYSTDPYINLAIEEYLVRHADCTVNDYLLLYVNEPCIVIGKNQSIYKEVNFEYLRNARLKLARRITGGGAVYHDNGNLSFSFISSFADEKINNYRHFNQPVVDALRKAGIPAEMDARNNILCNGKKISGNAQFTDRKNIISHGTLLLNADLSILRSCLKENDFPIETRAVGSVRSSVMNIMEVNNQFLSTIDLAKYLVQELKVNDTWHFSELEWNSIQQLADEKFRTFDWIYGRSPVTIIKREGLEIKIEDGLVVEISNQQSAISNIIGLPYQFNSIKTAVGEAMALKIF